jgi:hypothetical protein
LIAVTAAHLAVLAFVTAVIYAFDIEPHGVPARFWVLEALIVVSCCFPLINGRELRRVARKLWMPGGKPRSEEADVLRRQRRNESIAGVVLIIAFVLQLLALVPLLDETGGPIDSPFAQMSVAVAVFTPYLANNPITVGAVGVVIAGYYIALVTLMDTAGGSGPYLTVNLSILAIAVVLAMGAILRERELRGDD